MGASGYRYYRFVLDRCTRTGRERIETGAVRVREGGDCGQNLRRRCEEDHAVV